MLQFKKASEQASTLKTLGTVASFVGEKGYSELSSVKNFKGTVNADGNVVQKRVSMRLVNANGDQVYVNCSKPVGEWLRESSNSEELKSRIGELSSFNILELPQTDLATGEPIMIANEDTGEMEQLVLHSISFAGNSDMSATRVNITKEMVAKETAIRAVDWSELIAV
jgi:hypothetical protein